MSNALDEYRVKLEGMVADLAADISDIRSRGDQPCLNLMNFELNGLCLALRTLDEERYEMTSFTSPEWIEAHKTKFGRSLE